MRDKQQYYSYDGSVSLVFYRSATHLNTSFKSEFASVVVHLPGDTDLVELGRLQGIPLPSERCQILLSLLSNQVIWEKLILLYRLPLQAEKTLCSM